MRRLEVRFRPAALEDLQDIYLFVFRASANTRIARGFVDRIVERRRRIGDAPFGGPARDDLAPGLRIVPFERSAVIAYRVEDDCVRIIDVFYGGRDFEAFFRRGGAEDNR
ncbi:type II toxin-antitoxin system RelE/ParE family toxin [Methylosinus trichosporium OB3b]|uniref:Type II toxin-antitoxin system RelE/ParE family toxin n=1 Tax=Methylosinus trichosporium (strain ATCC 35070 / NCIMB 11131 / UNIQEM 75 / OB3b) TaxID=595536 RepID=A0A2D2CVL3_METT3|nr:MULTISPECIES: type II toxin-antitoxin system RelE/ParE family toxin [Methylosinus]ATQ66851.1 type II toxin-antitoxin system RelE/ParE family toxin [Methylosinus trichosporium OB3b]OBS54277.1 plasmid stabilization protein [Methylosinus sp. 3S-1]